MARLWIWARILWAAVSSRSNQLFYDRISKVYDDVFVAHRVHADTCVEVLSEIYADKVQDTVIMDLGCGTGMLTTMLAKRSRAVVGVDLSFESLRVLRQRSRCCRVIQADANFLPVLDESFQAVVCLGVWRHLPAIRQVLDEVSRVLTSDGVFVVGYFPPALGGAIKVNEGRSGRLLVWLYHRVTRQLGYLDRVDASLERETREEAKKRFTEVSTIPSGLHERVLVARYPGRGTPRNLPASGG